MQWSRHCFSVSFQIICFSVSFKIIWGKKKSFISILCDPYRNRLYCPVTTTNNTGSISKLVHAQLCTLQERRSHIAKFVGCTWNIGYSVIVIHHLIVYPCFPIRHFTSSLFTSSLLSHIHSSWVLSEVGQIWLLYACFQKVKSEVTVKINLNNVGLKWWEDIPKNLLIQVAKILR